MNDQAFVTTTALPVPTEMSVTKTYSLTMRHILAVQAMSEKASEELGRNVSQGEIIRTAIELLQEQFDAVFGTAVITDAGLKALSESEGE